MTDSLEKDSSKKSVKERTTGQFRCLYCFERVEPSAGAEKFTCPNCGFAWRISWFTPDEPRIRGPVWETNERLTREKMDQEKIAEQGGA